MASTYDRKQVMTPNSKEWLQKEAELKDKAFRVLTKSRQALKDAEIYLEKISLFKEEYPQSEVDKMGYLEKQIIAGKAECLLEQMELCEKQLFLIDQEYDQVRADVNSFYDKNLFKDISPEYPLLNEKLNPPKNLDPADWWKRD